MLAVDVAEPLPELWDVSVPLSVDDVEPNQVNIGERGEDFPDLIPVG